VNSTLLLLSPALGRFCSFEAGNDLGLNGMGTACGSNAFTQTDAQGFIRAELLWLIYWGKSPSYEVLVEDNPFSRSWPTGCDCVACGQIKTAHAI